MKLADQGWEDVGADQVKIIVRAVEVGGHPRNEVTAILGPVRLAEFDPGDLGNGIGFIGRLQVIAEEIFFPHWLRALPGIKAGGAQIKKLFDVIEMGGMDHGGVDHHVVVDEFRRPGGVGPDASNGARHE